jgi:hypothetical protein
VIWASTTTSGILHALGHSWLWMQCDFAGVQELELHEGHGGLKEATTLLGKMFCLRLNCSANFSLAGKELGRGARRRVAAGASECLCLA